MRESVRFWVWHLSDIPFCIMIGCLPDIFERIDLEGLITVLEALFEDRIFCPAFGDVCLRIAHDDCFLLESSRFRSLCHSNLFGRRFPGFLLEGVVEEHESVTFHRLRREGEAPAEPHMGYRIEPFPARQEPRPPVEALSSRNHTTDSSS